MRKIGFKIRVTIITLLIFILTSLVSFAGPVIFTDIGGHWAEGFIKDVYERQLITGYPDATFKPQGNITKLESLVIISRLMDYKEGDKDYYIGQYREELEANNIPDWGQGPVAYTLFNDVLVKEDLKTLVSKTGQTPAKRYELAIYIGRVLEHVAGEEVAKINVLTYRDEMNIPVEAKPYVELLVNKGILDETSNDRRFLPNDQITRAEVSKMISICGEILDRVSDDDVIVEPGPIITPPDITVTKVLEGYVDNIVFGDKNILSITRERDTDDRLVYEVAPNVDVRLNGKDSSLNSLQIGQGVLVTLKDDLVIDIEVSLQEDVLEGYFFYYLPNYGQGPQVFIKDSKDKTHSLSLTKDTRVYFMDKLVDIEDLEQGDQVTIRYIDNRAIEIEANPREEYFEGLVEAKNDNKGEYSLDILLEDGFVESFKIPAKASLRRDRKSIRFEEIKVGDEVEIITEYGQVSHVDAFSVRRHVEGYIKKIVIGQATEPTEISVEKYDGSLESFTLTPNAVIRLEGERAGIYDLRLNYQVELELENNEVVWMETYRKLQSSSYTGRVAYMDTRRQIIELEIENREEIEIHVDQDTIYNDEEGEKIGFRDIYPGDEILVVAENNGYYVVGKRVMVIIRR